MIESSYLKPLFSNKKIKNKIENAIETLKNVKFDTIAVRGVSGITFGFLLAFTLNKKFLIIRKPNESSHSVFLVEGDNNSKSYIIVDDFIDTGETVDTIVDAVKEFNPNCKFKGVLEWNVNNKMNFLTEKEYYD